MKYWARLYTPDVILGVYTPDEMTTPIERDITPVQTSQSVTELNQVIGKAVTVNAENHEKKLAVLRKFLSDFWWWRVRLKRWMNSISVMHIAPYL